MVRNIDAELQTQKQRLVFHLQVRGKLFSLGSFILIWLAKQFWKSVVCDVTKGTDDSSVTALRFSASGGSSQLQEASGANVQFDFIVTKR